MQARSSKNDAPDEKKRKDAAQRLATKSIKDHLQEASSLGLHSKYTDAEFPPTRFIWDDSRLRYTDAVLESLQLSNEDLAVAATITALREEGEEAHYVSVSKMQQRGRGRNARPVTIQVGHFVLCRGTPEDEFPWYVGEVKEVKSTPGQEPQADDTTIVIFEYGTGTKNPKTLGGKIDPSKVRWQARFQGQESRRTSNGDYVDSTRDEYHHSPTCQPSKPSLYAPVTLEVPMEVVVDWDVSEKMFTKASQARGRLLQKWAVLEVDQNVRVPWSLQLGPTTTNPRVAPVLVHSPSTSKRPRTKKNTNNYQTNNKNKKRKT